MAARSDAPFVHADTRADWRAWLEANHAAATGAWLVGWRKGFGPVLDYGEAVEEALCFGWVDSTGGRFDDRRSKLYFAPRRERSEWSASNKARVERLIADGRMRAAGLAAIERAKANGMWTALDEVEQGIVPDDLADALAAHPPAAERFAAFPWSARRALLLWVSQAKKPETRAARVLETAVQAARNERANQPRER
ncbi:MAG TPA: YdeI/OmpD-associated family protein [Candidatus Limnocylindrales bacterium]